LRPYFHAKPTGASENVDLRDAIRATFIGKLTTAWARTRAASVG